MTLVCHNPSRDLVLFNNVCKSSGGPRECKIKMMGVVLDIVPCSAPPPPRLQMGVFRLLPPAHSTSVQSLMELFLSW